MFIKIVYFSISIPTTQENKKTIRPRDIGKKRNVMPCGMSVINRLKTVFVITKKKQLTCHARRVHYKLPQECNTDDVVITSRSVDYYSNTNRKEAS